MSDGTSSAQPSKLKLYADWGTGCDSELQSVAHSLQGTLQSFQSTCRESAFVVRVDQCASQLDGYTTFCWQTDQWVGQVARDFLWADIFDSLFSIYMTNGEIDPAYLQFLLLSGSLSEVLAGHPAIASDLIAASDKSDFRSIETIISALKYAGLGIDASAVSDFTDILATGGDAWENIKTLLALDEGLVTSARKQGGWIRINGSDDLFEALGWSKDLTTIRVTGKGWKGVKSLLGETNSLALDSGKDAFWEGILPSSTSSGHISFGQVLTVLQVGFIGFDNWQEYKDIDSTKVVTGTIVDSAIKLGCGAIGAGVGSWGGGLVLGAALGAVSGGALAPVGVAIGSRVGGFFGGMAGDWVGNQILKTDFDEKVTDFLDSGVDAVIDHAQDAVADFAEGIQNTANKVDDAFDSAINSLTRFF